MEEIQRDELTNSTLQLLGLQQVPFAPGKEPTLFNERVAHHTPYTHVIAYTDGGSRGNPGPSASGFVIIADDETVICEGGAYLGRTTNNVAEYQAVYLALEKAQELGATDVEVRLDSQLVANQMNGLYKIKHPDLIPINARINELARQFNRVSYTHVRREYNTLADGMVNKILDKQSD